MRGSRRGWRVVLGVLLFQNFHFQNTHGKEFLFPDPGLSLSQQQQQQQQQQQPAARRRRSAIQTSHFLTHSQLTPQKLAPHTAAPRAARRTQAPGF